MLRPLINKYMAIVCLSLFFILAFGASAHRQDFRVTDAVLKADNANLSGTCPLKAAFNGYITTNGPGTVKYTFTRNDGATGPIYAMEFKEAGRQEVSTDWTLGDASALPHYVGWQAIKILSPNELKSDPALFELTCLKETPPQNKRPNLTDRIISVIAPPIEPAQPAKGQFIACPVKETRTEVTTQLPQPWWNTPQVGSLERVSVQTIGGNRTLVCEYQAYGRTVSIMRRFPEGATDCTAEGDGFMCH
jgi:hypothetical protein